MWDLWWAKWQLTGFFPSTLVFPRQYHPANAAYSFIHPLPTLFYVAVESVFK
jgi:hypothetical protein